MKKIGYVIYLILVFVLVFFLADYIEFKILEKKFYQTFQNLDVKVTSYFKYFDNDWFFHCVTSYDNYYEKLIKDFRGDVLSDENTMKPIILFGCSFAHGSQLEWEQTFAYKLSKKTKRNIYNRAIGACGIQHMYYMLTHSEFYETLPKNPEYIIYVYIPTQMMRLSNYVYPSEMVSNGPYLHYDIKEKELVLRKEITQLYKSFLFKRLMAEIDEKNHATNPNVREKNSELAIKLFVESKKMLLEKYPKTKFVILRYNVDYDGEEGFENPKMWEELEKEGFIIIKSRDLIGRNYREDETTMDNIHPSEAAWDLLVPKLVEELNL